MPSTRKRTPKTPAPVYVLEHGFRIDKIVVFDSAGENAEVRAIPDDVPDTNEAFDPLSPPCVEDFSLSVAKFAYRARWIAHMDSSSWYPSGAAVLLQLSAQRYVYLGSGAFAFEVQPRDEVVEFRVRLEGAEPLAWVRGKNNTYLLSSRLFVPNTHVDDCESTDDPFACTEGCEGTCHPLRSVVPFHVAA